MYRQLQHLMTTTLGTVHAAQQSSLGMLLSEPAAPARWGGAGAHAAPSTFPVLTAKRSRNHVSCRTAEQSSSSGVLLSDLLHLRDGAELVPVVFGCETRETGEIFNQAADGILGLGNSPVSLINQVSLGSMHSFWGFGKPVPQIC